MTKHTLTDTDGASPEIVSSDWMTVKDVAARLSVRESAVHNAISDGRLPSVFKFGRRFINAVDVRDYEARSRPDGVKAKGRPRKTKEPQ